MGSINRKAALWAGIIAGILFLILELLMVPIFLDGPMWGPPRMIGAIVLGEGVLPPPATFEIGVVLTAIILHLILSIIYAFVISAIIRNMSYGLAVIVGAFLGLVLYFINFYVMTGIWSWFENARNWVSITTHIVFGIAVGWAYVSLRERSAGGTRTPKVSA